MQRRGFLGAILAAGVAPALVGSGILMPVRAIALPSDEIVVPPWLTDTQRRAIEYEAPRYGGSFLRTNAGLRIGERFTIAGIPREFVVTSIMSSGTVSVAMA